MENEDLIGKTFGYLTVIKLIHKDKRGSTWLCKCICGNEIIFQKSHIVGTKTRNPNKSCGCKSKRQNGNTIKYKRLYSLWKGMLQRCYNPTADNYERYGEKGVYVCDKWKNNFDSFLEWALTNGYKDKLTIDRIDSQKPYSPNNCRWEDYFTQEANRGLNKNNTTGYKGVAPYKENEYRAHLMRKGIKKHLGCFKNLEEAIKAREDAIKLYEETGTF